VNRRQELTLLALAQAYDDVSEHVTDTRARQMLTVLAEDHLSTIRTHYEIRNDLSAASIRQASQLERAEAGL
jgi:hypothetical protein